MGAKRDDFVIVLETRRVRLRELEESDLEAVHAIFGDSDVMRFVDQLRPYGIDESRRAISEARKSYAVNGFGAWAFVEKGSGSLIGVGGLEMLPGRSVPEVSFVMARDTWGKGLATEIAGACLAYGLETLGLSRIGASVDPANTGSIRVLEKLGMRFVRKGLDHFGLPALFYEVSA